MGLLGALLAGSWASVGVAQEQRQPTLTIEAAAQLARTRHPRLAKHRAELAAARARLEQALSGYLPGLTGDFTFAPQTANYAPSPGVKRWLDANTPGTDDVVDSTGRGVTVTCIPPPANGGGVDHSVCRPPPGAYLPPESFRMHSFWTASVGVSWVVFDWGKTWSANRAASAMVDAELMSGSGAVAQIVLDAKLTYYDALTAEANVEVAEEAIAARTRYLETARGFHDVGRNTRIDVASAESAMASAELELVRARAAVDAAFSALAVAIGDDTVRSYELVPPAIASDWVPTDAEVATAAERRPEVREVAFRARSARAMADSASRGYLPQIQLQAGPWWSGASVDHLVTNVGGTLSLTYPGSNGMNPWLVEGRSGEASAQSDALAAQERTLRSALGVEARRARTQLLAARGAARSAERYVNAARERRDQAEARYKEGAGTFLELYDAELEYSSARFSEVRSRYDVGRAMCVLERALARS
jgi:outer membrane protein TolC